MAAVKQDQRLPTLSSHAVTVPDTALSAHDGHNAPATLPAFNLVLVDRAGAAPGNVSELPGTQIHDLPADVANHIAHLLGNENDRLAWQLSCKHFYRMPNTAREIRLLDHLLLATSAVPAALQNAVQLSPLSEELFSPQARTLIQLNAIYRTCEKPGSNADGVSWTLVGKNMLGEISAKALNDALSLYTEWIKLPGVLMQESGDLRARHPDAGLSKPVFLATSALIYRMQQPALHHDPATLGLCWLNALLTWSLRCRCAELRRLDTIAPPGEGFNPLLHPAYDLALPISSAAKTIVESRDKSQPLTTQFLTTLLALGLRNYVVFNGGEMGGAPLDQASAALFQQLAVPHCFETFYAGVQGLEENARATLLDAVSSDILSLQEHRQWSEHPFTQSYAQQAACMLLCSLLMQLNRGAIAAGDKTGMNVIRLTLHALESELWVIRKILATSDVPGFPRYPNPIAEPDSSADSDETDTTAIGWDAAFDIIDAISSTTLPADPLPDLDKRSFVQSLDFAPDQDWEFDQEQRQLLKSIHLTTRTFHDLAHYIALLPDALNIEPLKQQLRAIADLWPHEVQRDLLLDWVNALR